MKTFVLAIVVVGCVHAAEFRGRLDPEVELGTRVLSPLGPAPAAMIALLPTPPPADARVWSLKRPFDIKGKTYALAVVAAASGEKTLWLDRDGDGKFSADERWPFPADAKAVSLALPWDNGIYREFPCRLEYSTEPLRRPSPPAGTTPPPAALSEPPGPTLVTALVYNFNILYSGSVEIDGRPMKITIAPRPNDIAIDLTKHRVSMDTNFNGRIEPEFGEAENPSGKIPVFRAGDRYLAIKSADLQTGALVVEERPASDYTRFDASPGQTMPDFAFTDLDGGKHKLFDYRGKFVLLDFWGTWCGPCIAEMQHMAPLYRRYHERGLEIIGLDMEKTAGHLSAADYAAVAEKARVFIAKAGHPWPQATQESIERVALDVVHVNAYPTCILVGPDGKILSRDAHGTILEELLAKHLP